MISSYYNFIFFLDALIFVSVIFMHLSRKSFSVVSLYILQSLALVVLLINSAFKENSLLLMLAILIIFIVKVLVASHFFFGLIKKHHLKFSVSTYLNGPVTLIILALLTAITYSNLFRPLAVIFEQNGNALLLSIATILISIFLIINRKGALSQMIGILSLENGIVVFATLAGLEQSPVLQIGIMFDILVWIFIASIFVSMVYSQFGSLDVSSMTNLKEK